MAPRKPKTLAQIIAEGKAFRTAAMPVAKGSGFDMLAQRNNAFLNGTTRGDGFDEKAKEGGRSRLTVVKKVVKIQNRIQKTKKVPKQQVAPKPHQRTPTPPPLPPPIESWPTAAGNMIVSENHTVPTPFLGIARIPTTMEQPFKTALRVILDPIGGAEEFATDVHESSEGGESSSEISARFFDEHQAGEVMEKINGAECLGRRLQLSFTPNF